MPKGSFFVNLSEDPVASTLPGPPEGPLGTALLLFPFSEGHLVQVPSYTEVLEAPAPAEGVIQLTRGIQRKDEK